MVAVNWVNFLGTRLSQCVRQREESLPRRRATDGENVLSSRWLIYVELA